MTPPSDPTESDLPDDLELLVLQALDRQDGERRQAVERLCSAHPGHAAELRKWLAAASEPPAPALRAGPGRRVDDYRLLEPLGSGGMGEVWLAERVARPGEHVALKLIRLGLDGELVSARFEAECRALARMEHPNIARILDAGKDADGRPWLAMEYAPGLPLLRHCDVHRCTVEQRLAAFLEVCAGVQHAHQKGILHRDLKPANVLVTERDGRPVPKVIDFGLARAIDPEAAGSAVQTQLGTMPGTPEYMSPEQLGPRAPDVDTRSDVYALGVVLHELLTGRRPFEVDADTPLDELCRRIRLGDAPRPSTRFAADPAAAEIAAARSTSARTLTRRLRADLDWIVLRAIARDPARRYQSVAELAADVRRHVAGDPVQAGPPTVAYRLGKWARKHRAAAAAAALLLASLVVGLAVSLLLWSQAARAHEEAEVRSRELSLAMRRLQGMSLAVLQKLHDAQSALAGGIVVEADVLDELESVVYEGYDPDQTAALRQVLSRPDEMPVDLAQRWQAAIAAIERADGRTASALYAGTRIAAQQDLVPLGPDPESGLWEFYHPASARPDEPIPERDSEPRIVMTPGRGLVFVLVPGGRYEIGALEAPPPGTEPETDEHRFTVDLDPFYVSKYELTRGQWLRMSGTPVQSLIEAPDDHPAIEIPWVSAAIVLPTYGMRLPSEAQWEVAARGRSRARWPEAGTRDRLRLYANLSDEAAQRTFPEIVDVEPWDDGHAVHAPVGSFLPNAFGLFDTLGNVGEWCLDRYVAGDEPPPRPGDGLRTGAPAPGGSLLRCCRGGGFAHVAEDCTVSYRNHYRRDRDGYIGVRPVRPAR